MSVTLQDDKIYSKINAHKFYTLRRDIHSTNCYVSEMETYAACTIHKGTRIERIKVNGKCESTGQYVLKLYLFDKSVAAADVTCSPEEFDEYFEPDVHLCDMLAALDSKKAALKKLELKQKHSTEAICILGFAGISLIFASVFVQLCTASMIARHMFIAGVLLSIPFSVGIVLYMITLSAYAFYNTDYKKMQQRFEAVKYADSGKEDCASQPTIRREIV